MNLEQLQEKLLRAARVNPPEAQVPYAFEKRITALLKANPAPDRITLWARALWRAAAPCAAIALLLGIWTLAGDRQAPSEQNLAQYFEQTILAGIDQSVEVW